MKEVNTYTEADIKEWKAKYGKIYKIGVDGEDYIWRKIKRSEYTSIMANEEESSDLEKIYKRQEEIAKLIILYPSNIEQILQESAGLATTIADEALLKSGFEVTTVTTEL